MREGRRAYVVSGPYHGLYRFNGSCAFYESYRNRGLGDVFYERADALWVRDQERGFYFEMASKRESDERREYEEKGKAIEVLPIFIPNRVGPSPDVRAMRIANREMKRTGWFPSSREVNELIEKLASTSRDGW